MVPHGDPRGRDARFLDAAHQQLNGPVVLVWDNLNTHVSRAMAELVAARSWLTRYRLPPYASELNPVELGPLAVVQCSRDGARVQAELLAEHGEIVVAGDPVT